MRRQLWRTTVADYCVVSKIHFPSFLSPYSQPFEVSAPCRPTLSLLRANERTLLGSAGATRWRRQGRCGCGCVCGTGRHDSTPAYGRADAG